MYAYLVIRGDPAHTARADAGAVKALLRDALGLVPRTDCVYASRPGSPWLEVVLATASADGSYAALPEGCATTVNLIEVITTGEHLSAARDVATQIAAPLGWSVTQDDAG